MNQETKKQIPFLSSFIQVLKDYHIISSYILAPRSTSECKASQRVAVIRDLNGVGEKHFEIRIRVDNAPF